MENREEFIKLGSIISIVFGVIDIFIGFIVLAIYYVCKLVLNNQDHSSFKVFQSLSNLFLILGILIFIFAIFYIGSGIYILVLKEKFLISVFIISIIMICTVLGVVQGSMILSDYLKIKKENKNLKNE